MGPSSGSLTSELNLLETINSCVKVKVDMDSVRDKNPVINIRQTLLIELLEFLKERGARRRSVKWERKTSNLVTYTWKTTPEPM
jgi:hypothetical protein